MEHNVFAVNKQLIIPRKSLLDKDYCCKLNKVFLQRTSKHPKKITYWERLFLQMKGHFFATSKQASQEHCISRENISPNGTWIICSEQTLTPRKSFLDKDYCCKLNKFFCNEQANIPRKSHSGKNNSANERGISLQRASTHPKNIASRER